MRPTRILWLGAAGAIAVVVMALSGSPQAASRGDVRVPRAAHDPRIETIEADLERIASGLEALGSLAERLGRLESGLADLNAQPVVAASDTVAERERILADLHEGAKALSADPRQRAEAIDAWALVAATTEDPARRAEAWFEEAKLRDVSMAAELLAQVIEAVGLESKLGQDAAYLLAYCQNGNVTESMRIWRELAKAPNLPRERAARTRIMAAHMAVTHGDDDLAIREYDQLVADYRDDPDEKCREIARWAAACRANAVQRQR